jgi:hypothetical protein
MPAIATIYEHSNYSGRTLQLQGVGDYDYSTLASYSFNDLTSSIKIESGYYLQAFADAGFKGASAIFTGSSSYVGNGFNDKISSLRVVRGIPSNSLSGSMTGAASSSPQLSGGSVATIYEHSNYAGKPLRLQGEGAYDYSTLLKYGFNDLTSSVQISPGYYIEAYADPGFKGASAILTGYQRYIGDGFNDKISSLRIVRGTPNTSFASGTATQSFVDTLTDHSFWNNLASRLDQQAASNKQVNQGVWNKSGFVLGVNWKDPITGNIVKSETIPIGRGSYFTAQGNPYNADLWIWGKEVAEIAVAAGALTAAALTGGAALFAVGAKLITAGAAAPPALGGLMIASGKAIMTGGVGFSADMMAAGLSAAVSKNADIFWSGTPSLDSRHADVWGTVWSPQVGSGGLL